MWMVTAAVPPLELELLELLELLEPLELELELLLELLELALELPDELSDPPPPPPQAASSTDSRAADNKAVNFFMPISRYSSSPARAEVTGNTVKKDGDECLIGIAVLPSVANFLVAASPKRRAPDICPAISAGPARTNPPSTALHLVQDNQRLTGLAPAGVRPCGLL